MTVNERLEGVTDSFTRQAVIEANNKMDVIVQEALKNTGKYMMFLLMNGANYYL
jgi:hypothetical protein